MDQNEIEGLAVVVSLLGVGLIALIVGLCVGACRKRPVMTQPPLLPMHANHHISRTSRDNSVSMGPHVPFSVTAVPMLFSPTVPRNLGAQQIVNRCGDNTLPSYNTAPRPSEYALAYHEASGRYSGVDPPSYAPPAPAKTSQSSSDNDEMPELYQRLFDDGWETASSER